MGFYERFLDALHNVVRGTRAQRRDAIAYLAKLGVGWAIGMGSCVMLLAGLVVAMLAGNLAMKNLFARPRPCWLDESVPLLIARPSDYSFPSGHTMAAAIGATILTAADRRFGWAAIPLAVLIAFSRMYLYVHFPSDILGGAVLGVGIGLLMLYAGRRFARRKEQ